jgi:hypothetical protein
MIRELTHATSNLGIWLNGKIGLYLEDLANPCPRSISTK